MPDGCDERAVDSLGRGGTMAGMGQPKQNKTVDFQSIVGRRVCIDLDTGSLVNDRTKSKYPATVIYACQITNEQATSGGWRNKDPILEIRVRLDDGREYDATDSDIFGFLAPLPEPQTD
jgi:hypothetical protein